MALPGRRGYTGRHLPFVSSAWKNRSSFLFFEKLCQKQKTKIVSPPLCFWPPFMRAENVCCHTNPAARAPRNKSLPWCRTPPLSPLGTPDLDLFQVEVSSVVMTPQDLAMLAWGFSALSHEWLPGQVRYSSMLETPWLLFFYMAQ